MNNDLDLTFLTKEQVENLEILKKYGTKAAITDFAILLGSCVTSDYYTSERKALKNRSGWWWTKASDGDNTAGVVYEDGNSFWGYIKKRDGGGDTNFNTAVNAFSDSADNKIIFTDGYAAMPDKELDAIWIVYGIDKIKPKGGRVIYINEEELKNLKINSGMMRIRRK